MSKERAATNLVKNVSSQKLAFIFALLTMGISWTLWWAIVIGNQYGLLNFGTPIMMLFYVVGAMSPAIVAIILTLKSKQMTGKKLVRTLCNFRQPLSLYLIIIVVAILYYIIPLIMNKATIIAPLYISIISIPLEVFGGGLEEIGWRFYFQPILEKKFNFTISTIITAIVWAVWHLPLFFIAGTNQFTWSFFVFSILVLGISFVLAAIYRTSKSVLLCILFHSVWNAIGDAIAVDMNFVSIATISIIMIAISFVLLRFFKKTISSSKKAR